MTAHTLLRHWNSVISRGVGYEPTPAGRHLDAKGVAGYYVDFSAKTTSLSAAAPEALLPAALAQLALGWWERILDGDPGAEEGFLDVCRLLEHASVKEGESRLWFYRVRVPKYRMEPPWISALAQAQAASVFVRAYLRYGKERYREIAVEAIRPLVQKTRPTVVVRLPAGLALEECPGDPASLILNGWVYATWGLRDVALGLGSETAARMLDDTSACLVAMLPRYDIGWWTRYSLFPYRLPDLAKPFYHRLHVVQMEIMSRLTGDSVFDHSAERWRGYDVPSKRVALVTQKMAFVASRYR